MLSRSVVKLTNLDDVILHLQTHDGKVSMLSSTSTCCLDFDRRFLRDDVPSIVREQAGAFLLRVGAKFTHHLQHREQTTCFQHDVPGKIFCWRGNSNRLKHIRKRLCNQGDESNLVRPAADSLLPDFEAALAKVQAQLDIIPQKASDEIAKNCDVDSYDFEKLREETNSLATLYCQSCTNS